MLVLNCVGRAINGYNIVLLLYALIVGIRTGYLQVVVITFLTVHKIMLWR